MEYCANCNIRNSNSFSICGSLAINSLHEKLEFIRSHWELPVSQSKLQLVFLSSCCHSPWWTSPAGRPCTDRGGCRGSSPSGPAADLGAGTWQTSAGVAPTSLDPSPCPSCLQTRCVSGCCLPSNTGEVNVKKSQIERDQIMKVEHSSHLRKKPEIRFGWTTGCWARARDTAAARPEGWWRSLENKVTHILLQ